MVWAIPAEVMASLNESDVADGLSFGNLKLAPLLRELHNTFGSEARPGPIEDLRDAMEDDPETAAAVAWFRLVLPAIPNTEDAT
jgi:hypothetical protein